MTEVRAYHPETGHVVVVDSEALDHHLRQAGWVSEAEHQETQAAAAEAEAKAAKPAVKKEQA